MTRYPTLLPPGLRPSRLIGTTVPATAMNSPKPSYRLGDPGRPATVPTLLIAVFDNSGSVITPGGTDPLSNRFAEVDRAFSVVARKGARHELGAVLHFDTPTSGDVAPVPITRRGLAVLRRGLAIPPDGAGSSELAPSLAAARRLAEDHSDHEVTLVVLSDFLLLDTNPAAVLRDLIEFPGQVHAVALGGHVPPELDGDTITSISRGDPPGAVAAALFASLTVHRPGARPHHGLRR